MLLFFLGNGMDIEWRNLLFRIHFVEHHDGSTGTDCKERGGKSSAGVDPHDDHILRFGYVLGDDMDIPMELGVHQTGHADVFTLDSSEPFFRG